MFQPNHTQSPHLLTPTHLYIHLRNEIQFLSISGAVDGVVRSLKQAAPRPSSPESEHARFAVVSGISSPTHHSLGLTRPRRDLTHNPIPPPGTRVAYEISLRGHSGYDEKGLSTADSTDSAVALLSQEPLVRTECLAGEGTPPSPARPARARSFSPPTTPLDLRAHGSPQPEPRLLPSDPYTSPRGGGRSKGGTC